MCCLPSSSHNRTDCRFYFDNIFAFFSLNSHSSAPKFIRIQYYKMYHFSETRDVCFFLSVLSCFHSIVTQTTRYKQRRTKTKNRNRSKLVTNIPVVQLCGGVRKNTFRIRQSPSSVREVRQIDDFFFYLVCESFCSEYYWRSLYSEQCSHNQTTKEATTTTIFVTKFKLRRCAVDLLCAVHIYCIYL